MHQGVQVRSDWVWLLISMAAVTCVPLGIVWLASNR